MRVVHEQPCIKITPNRRAITRKPIDAFSDDDLEYYCERVAVGLARNKAADAELRCKGTLALVVDPSSVRPAQRYGRFKAVVVAIDVSAAYGLTADNAREELKGPFGSWILHQLKWDVSSQHCNSLLSKRFLLCLASSHSVISPAAIHPQQQEHSKHGSSSRTSWCAVPSAFCAVCTG
jgi:hypothetical protein